MKLNRKIAALALAGAMALGAGLTPIKAIASDLWEAWVIIGGPTYCASYVTGTTGQICQHQVPAGPTAFSGNEFVPADLGPIGQTSSNGGPQEGIITLPQLGQGALADMTPVATAMTIPNNTPFYFLDGAQGSAITITMPASPTDGYIQRVTCEAATVGTVAVAANTSVNASQTLKLSPGVACVAGVTYSWRYYATNSTWYRF